MSDSSDDCWIIKIMLHLRFHTTRRIFRITKWDLNVKLTRLGISEGIFVAVCVTAAGYVLLCVNPHRHKAPVPLRSWQPPPFWLGRSWGLTFHFSDPLFLRANSYAGLEMCYVAGWDKNQGQCQNNAWLLVLGYLCSFRWHHLHYKSYCKQGAMCNIPLTHNCLLYFYLFTLS